MIYKITFVCVYIYMRLWHAVVLTADQQQLSCIFSNRIVLNMNSLPFFPPKRKNLLNSSKVPRFMLLCGQLLVLNQMFFYLLVCVCFYLYLFNFASN